MVKINKQNTKDHRKSIRKVTASKLPRSLQPVFSINDVFQWIRLSENSCSKYAYLSFSLEQSSNVSPSMKPFQTFFCDITGGLFEHCASAHIPTLLFDFYPTVSGEVRNSELKRLRLKPSKLTENINSFKSTSGCLKQLNGVSAIFKAALETESTSCSTDIAFHLKRNGPLQNYHTTELRVLNGDSCAVLKSDSDYSEEEDSEMSAADEDFLMKKKVAMPLKLNEGSFDHRVYDFRSTLARTEIDSDELSATPNFLTIESRNENTQESFKAKNLSGFPIFTEELLQNEAVPGAQPSMSFFGDMLGFVPTQCNTTTYVLSQQSQKSVNECTEVNCTSVRTVQSVPFQCGLESQRLKEDDYHLSWSTVPKRKSRESNEHGKRLKLLSRYIENPTKSQSIITVQSQDADSTTDATCQHEYGDTECEASIINISGIASWTKQKVETPNFHQKRAEHLKLTTQRTSVETEKFNCCEEVTNKKQTSMNPPVTTTNGIRLTGAAQVGCIPTHMVGIYRTAPIFVRSLLSRHVGLSKRQRVSSLHFFRDPLP